MNLTANLFMNRAMNRSSLIAKSAALAIMMFIVAPHAFAQFALAVVPPRFELKAKPGDKLREVIELSNTENRAGRYSLKTNDWVLMPDASVDFKDELAANSCRPWVAIERKDVTVPPNRPYRYRYEVAVPADAKPQECRFAIMIEGQEQITKSGPMSVPISARLGLIVYVVVGDAKPALEIKSHRVKMVEGKPAPVIQVTNTGLATGRVAGLLKGTDASGAALEFTPATTPILPGETREIAFTATRVTDANELVQPKFPVTLKGKVEAGVGNVVELDRAFAQ
jgi:hypothetical protein